MVAQTSFDIPKDCNQEAMCIVTRVTILHAAESDISRMPYDEFYVTSCTRDLNFSLNSSRSLSANWDI